MLHVLSTLALVAGLTSAHTDSTELRREELMAALRKGGYTILLRHGRTDRTFKEDVVMANGEIASVPVERFNQRNLTDDGVRDARLMGAVLRKYQIPLGEVLASPMFRTKETAEYVSGTPVLTLTLRMLRATPEQVALIAAVPKPGSNRLLVTHHFVIEHVAGIKPGDVDESGAAVVRTLPDGRVQLVGLISLADWQAMGSAAESAPTPASAAPPAAHAPPSRPAGQPYASTAASGQPVEIPHTPAGRFAQAYIAAFNSGDRNKMAAFIESSLVPNSARPTEARIASYLEMYNENGELTLVGVTSAEGNQLVLALRSRHADITLTVNALTDPAGRASVSLAAQQRG